MTISFPQIFEKSYSSKTYYRGKSYEWILKIQTAKEPQINFKKSRSNPMQISQTAWLVDQKNHRGGPNRPPPGRNRVNKNDDEGRGVKITDFAMTSLMNAP